MFTVYAPLILGNESEDDSKFLEFIRNKGIDRIAQTVIYFDVIRAPLQDIPQLISEFREKGEVVFGITDECSYKREPTRINYPRGFPRECLILDDSRFRNLDRVTDFTIMRQGPYQEALFGLPALCLLSKELGISPPAYVRERGLVYRRELVPESLDRVVLNRNFSSIAKGRIPDGTNFCYVDSRNIFQDAQRERAQWVVDVVNTGTTAQSYGWGIVALLGTNDGVILGNRRAQEFWKIVQYFASQIGGDER